MFGFKSVFTGFSKVKLRNVEVRERLEFWIELFLTRFDEATLS